MAADLDQLILVFSTWGSDERVGRHGNDRLPGDETEDRHRHEGKRRYRPFGFPIQSQARHVDQSGSVGGYIPSGFLLDCGRTERRACRFPKALAEITHAPHIVFERSKRGNGVGFEILILAAIVAMRLFPESPLSQLLHLHLVVRPMDWFSKLERHHLLYAVLLIGMLFAAGEIIAVLGSADVALALAWDVSIYLDAVAVAAAIAVARQARIAIRLIRSKGSSIVTRPAARRSGRERRDRASSTPPANDKDAPAPAFYCAA